MAAEPVLPSIDYTSRDYLALREDLIRAVQQRIPGWSASDPADFGMALVEAFAYMGDVTSYYIDRAANESFLATATQRQSLLDIANMLGYYPANPTAAVSSRVVVYNPTSAVATVSNGDRFTTNVQTANGMKTLTFEATVYASDDLDATQVSIPGSTTAITHVTVMATEGQTVSYEAQGASNGSAEQEFTLRATPIIEGSVRVFSGVADASASTGAYGNLRYGEMVWSSGPTEYERMIGYSDAGPNSAIYFLRTDADGATTIRFGDGVNGRIPPKDEKIFVSYRIGGGAVGNLPAGTQLQGPGSLYAVLGDPSTGGSDAESNASIRRNASSTFRSRNRAVTKRDFSDLALTIPGVAKAAAQANAYSSVTVCMGPSAASGEIHPGFTSYLVTSASYVVGTTLLGLRIPGLVAPDDLVGKSFDLQGVHNFGPLTGLVVDHVDVVAYPGEPIIYAHHAGLTAVDAPCAGVFTLGETGAMTRLRASVKRTLEDRATVGCAVTVSPPAYTELKVGVTIYVEPTVRWSVARRAAIDTIKSMFDYENRELGAPVRPKDLVIALATRTEIGWADVTTLGSAGDFTTPGVQDMVPWVGEMYRLLDGNIQVKFGGGLGINDLGSSPDLLA
jgi:hypothetical protein